MEGDSEGSDQKKDVGGPEVKSDSRGSRKKRRGGQGRNRFGGGQGRPRQESKERVNREPNSNRQNGLDRQSNKRHRAPNPEFRIMERIQSLQGQTCDLPPKSPEVKKFTIYTRLYFGNVSSSTTEKEVKELFAEFGEINDMFFNREKGFGFLKMDYRTNAEKARAQLDQHVINGHTLRVRFAPASVRVKVKNLSPMVSNELLELGFSVFGEVERAVVFVDEKGRSIGEGIVDFAQRNFASAAHNFCTANCYFLTSETRPVITEMGAMHDIEEGLLEVTLPKREHNQNRELVYYKAREVGPRVAERGSFEEEYGNRWKSLVLKYQQRQEALKEEMERDMETFQNQMEVVRYDYETEKLRERLRRREMEFQQHRIPRDGNIFDMGANFRGANAPVPRGSLMGDFLDTVVARSQENVTFDRDQGMNFENSKITPLMALSGLMERRQAPNLFEGERAAGPTWELPVLRVGHTENDFEQQATRCLDTEQDEQMTGTGRATAFGGGYNE